MSEITTVTALIRGQLASPEAWRVGPIRQFAQTELGFAFLSPSGRHYVVKVFDYTDEFNLMRGPAMADPDGE